MDTKEVSKAISNSTKESVKESSDQNSGDHIHKYFTISQRRRQQRKKAAQLKKKSINSEYLISSDSNSKSLHLHFSEITKSHVEKKIKPIESNQEIGVSKKQTKQIESNEEVGVSKKQTKQIESDQEVGVSKKQTKQIESNQEVGVSKKQTKQIERNQEIGVNKKQTKQIVSNQEVGVSKKQNKDIESGLLKPLTIDKSKLLHPSIQDNLVDSKSIKMDQNQNKSRDEVKAAREEKKKLKHLAKTESKNKTDAKTEDKSQSKINSIDENNKLDTKLNKENSNNKLASKQTNDSKSIKVEASQPDINSNNDSLSENKSREEIKAEREAKKLAKQMAKNKPKGVPNNVSELENKLANVTLNSSNDGLVSQTPNKDTQKSPTIKVDKTCQPQKTEVDENAKETEKSKAELRAERRAKQEAQRAAKAMLQSVAASPKVNDKKKTEVNHLEKPKPINVSTELKKSQSPDKSKSKNAEHQHKVKLFDHLYVQRESNYLESPIPLNSKEIHPAIVRLGVQYASHIVMGSNARCIALLNALKEVIEDYTLPPNVEFSRGLEAHLKPCIKFLDSCRLPAVSMKNALKHIKWQLRHMPNNIAEYDAKMKLHDAIDTYVKEQIEVAGQAISNAVRKKISDDDVILTYGCSSLIERIITEAALEKRFRVVIVAAHPWNEGRELLRRLTAKGVKCSLVMISALSFIMREINKVLLGAGALLANGYVMARAGTAQVAMVAHAHNVPVLVCCETHKFSERVQTDSIVFNEIGNPDDLINCDPSHKEGPLANWRSNNNLTLLNLTYDVTPPDLVTAVVTELAILPCTSVPVILRIKPSEFSV